jgi:hypothetical protein
MRQNEWAHFAGRGLQSEAEAIFKEVSADNWTIRGQTGRFLISYPRMARISRIVRVNNPHHATPSDNASQFVLSSNAERSENVPSESGESGYV